MVRYTETHRNDRTCAITALSRFGVDAKPAVPLLLSCLSDEDGPTRLWATKALEVIEREIPAEPKREDSRTKP